MNILRVLRPQLATSVLFLGFSPSYASAANAAAEVPTTATNETRQASDETTSTSAVAPEPASTPVPAAAPDPTLAADAAPVPTATSNAAPAADPVAIPTKDEASQRQLDSVLSHFKPGKGVQFVSADENFGVNMNFWVSVLYTLQNAHGEGQQDQSLQFRRARFKLGGWALSKHNRFGIELALSPRDMAQDGEHSPHASPLLDWFLNFDYLRDAELTVGQFKVQYNREHVTSASALNHVDLSLANNEFNFNRDMGVDIGSKDFLGLGLLRYHLAIYQGKGRDPFAADQMPPGSTNFGMLYAARMDVLPFGMFDDYREGDLDRQEKFGFSLGLGYNYQDRAVYVRGNQGPFFNDGGTANYHNVVVDWMAKYRGASFSGGVFYRDGTRHLGNVTVDDGSGTEVAPAMMYGRNGYGITASAAYLMPSIPLEIVARYSTVRPFAAKTDLHTQEEYIAGANWYFFGHNLKLQAEYAYIVDKAVFENGADRIRLQILQNF